MVSQNSQPTSSFHHRHPTNIITREWGIVFIAAIVFFLGSESYKYMKRAFFRRKDAKKGKEDYTQDVEERVFQRYMTESSMASEPEKGSEKV
jgi:Na+-exporting ATPase